MKKGLISGLVLLSFGIVCGLLLAVVNHFTGPIIKANEDRVKYEMLGTILADFDPREVVDFEIVELDLEGRIDKAYFLNDKDSGEVVYVFYSVSATGWQSDIVMLIAVDASMVVKGYTIVSENDTAGVVEFIYTVDFQMEGRLATDVIDVDEVSAATTAKVSLGACIQCFHYVAERVVIDLGGDE